MQEIGKTCSFHIANTYLNSPNDAARAMSG